MEHSDQRRTRGHEDSPQRAPGHEGGDYRQRRDFGDDRASDERYRRGRSGEWQGDLGRTTTPEQRERGFQPREEWRSAHDHEFAGSGRGLYRSHYAESHDAPGGETRGGRGHRHAESWPAPGPHTGRGPKGYKRSDQQIVEEASQRLEHDGHVDATDIEVSAADGIVTLRGSVPDRAMKRRAEDCVESVYGTRDVMNELHLSQASHGTEPATASFDFTQTARSSGSGASDSELAADDRKSGKSTGKH